MSSAKASGSTYLSTNVTSKPPFFVHSVYFEISFFTEDGQSEEINPSFFESRHRVWKEYILKKLITFKGVSLRGSAEYKLVIPFRDKP